MSSLYLAPIEYHEEIVDRRTPRPERLDALAAVHRRKLPRRRWLVLR